MNTLDTLRLMVRNYPGGITSLAPRLKKAVSTLEKELRGAEGFKLGALDAEEISAMCIEARCPNCYDYANAIAQRCGGFVELPANLSPDQSIQVALTEVVKEACDVLMSWPPGGAASDNQMKRFTQCHSQLLSKAQEVHTLVKAAHQAERRGGEGAS